MITTSFTTLVGVEAPIQLAGMPGIATPELVAAGGIATDRALAAVLACGCGAARVGTRFVASTESGAHPDYVRALLGASGADTCLTEAFGADWPDAPHRVLRSAIAAAEALSQDIVAELVDGAERLLRASSQRHESK